jgi:hypothetical protein
MEAGEVDEAEEVRFYLRRFPTLLFLRGETR